MYRLKKENSEPLTTIKTDTITKSFIWAQWDCDIQSLYFIHFRKTSLLAEDEDPEKREESPTLSCFQFHEDLPHETVVNNAPLNGIFDQQEHLTIKLIVVLFRYS